MVMAAGGLISLASPAAKAIAAKVRKRLKGQGKGSETKRRRPRRIVFSENQWEFVRSLMRSTTGRSLPPARRRRRGRRPFAG